MSRREDIDTIHNQLRIIAAANASPFLTLLARRTLIDGACREAAAALLRIELAP